YYNPEEKYKWTEDVCSQCGQTKGGYARNISVQVKEIVDSDRMVSVKRCPSNLKDAIAEFLMDYDEFVCLECECEDEK
ncbi:MAG: hypothetical protein U0944_03250, partial [Candidatus Moranbacteria bacterium]|nr:hypothetical protein [Candidatus Moranbacteria bacterium]